MLKGYMYCRAWCRAPEMNAELDAGPVQLFAMAVAVPACYFGGILPPLIQIVEGARSFRLGLRELGGL